MRPTADDTNPGPRFPPADLLGRDEEYEEFALISGARLFDGRLDEWLKRAFGRSMMVSTGGFIEVSWILFERSEELAGM